MTPCFGYGVASVVTSLKLTRLEECPTLLREEERVVRGCGRTLGSRSIAILRRCARGDRSDNRLCLIHIGKGAERRYGGVVRGVTRGKVTAGMRCGPLPLLATCGGLNFSVGSCPGTCTVFRGRVALPLRAGLSSRSIRCVVGSFGRYL